MKKIIAAIDGLKYSESTVKYAIALAREAHAHIVGIFLDDVSYHSYKIYELTGEYGVSEAKLAKFEHTDEETRKQSVSRFENACRHAGLDYTVHHDTKLAIRELLHESIYADLMVIDRKETLTHYEDSIPPRFIRDLLADTQCPVCVAPEVFIPVEKIVLLYDGQPTSVHAIRMFSYLFPSFNRMPVEMISVKTSDYTLFPPDNRLMKEFMRQHYPNSVHTIMQGDPDFEITALLKQRDQHELVVLGAQRRSMASRWFKASMADKLMQHLKTPLFIAH